MGSELVTQIKAQALIKKLSTLLVPTTTPPLPPAGMYRLSTPDGSNLVLTDSAGLYRQGGITDVRLATFTAGTLASSFEVGDTVDGQVLALNDWILIGGQAAPAENGVRIVQASGAPVRAPGWDTAAGVATAGAIEVASGTSGGKIFTTTFKSTDTLNTTAMNWFQMVAENSTAIANTRPWVKSTAFRSTADVRILTSAAVAQQTSGQVTMMGIYLYAGDLVTTISAKVGGTAGATLTHTWAGICTSDRTLRAVSADNTATPWAIDTARDFNMGTPYPVTATGWYYLALVVVGTTMPTFHGSTSVAATVLNEQTGITTFGKSSTTGLTTPSSVSTTFGAITAANGFYFMWVS